MLFGDFLGPALLAGSCIAVASGLLGWFLVLRAQVFAGDALSHVAFTGALAAAAAGVDLRLGLFVGTVLVAVWLAALGMRGTGASGQGRASQGADDVTIGMVFVWVLGLGVLFLNLFNAGASGANGAIAARTLFGSLFSLSSGGARLAALIAAALALALLAIARPLLLVSLDAPLARARGVPVRALGLVFLALVGLDAAEATQAVGALLLLGLLVAPAGAALRLTPRPYLSLALSVAIALAATWIGLGLAYLTGTVPPGSAVVLVAVLLYLFTIRL
jgi:zinc/manganese transport system permease protein